MRRALIIGLAGHTLRDDERVYLKESRPLGIILFARNLQSHNQIRRLIDDACAAIESNSVLVLIDQEGGRVQRLRPPLGRALPPARSYAAMYANDPEQACESAYLAARLLADDLTQLGINCDCAPVLDIPTPGAHDIIGDRAYGTNPDQVIALARAVAQGFIHGSVLPVIKHIPGHGRATADSHLALPIVDTNEDELTATDFAPFAALKDIPAAMTAHVIYSAIDNKAPASTSRKMIGDVIRDKIGYQGFLMSDDVSMKALDGALEDRASKVINAGCDAVLHCNGDMREMEAVAKGTREFEENPNENLPFQRFMDAIAVTKGCSSKPFDSHAATAALDDVLSFDASMS